MQLAFDVPLAKGRGTTRMRHQDKLVRNSFMMSSSVSTSLRSTYWVGMSRVAYAKKWLFKLPLVSTDSFLTYDGDQHHGSEYL